MRRANQFTYSHASAECRMNSFAELVNIYSFQCDSGTERERTSDEFW